MADGWICNGCDCDCQDWEPATWGLCVISVLFAGCTCCIPVVPFCTKCGTRANEERDVTKINAEQPTHNDELKVNVIELKDVTALPKTEKL